MLEHIERIAVTTAMAVFQSISDIVRFVCECVRMSEGDCVDEDNVVGEGDGVTAGVGMIGGNVQLVSLWTLSNDVSWEAA